jgi:hypothetical protein
VADDTNNSDDVFRHDRPRVRPSGGVSPATARRQRSAALLEAASPRSLTPATRSRSCLTPGGWPPMTRCSGKTSSCATRSASRPRQHHHDRAWCICDSSPLIWTVYGSWPNGMKLSFYTLPYQGFACLSAWWSAPQTRLGHRVATRSSIHFDRAARRLPRVRIPLIIDKKMAFN